MEVYPCMMFRTRKEKFRFWYPCLGHILVYKKNAELKNFLPQGEIAKWWTQGGHESRLITQDENR
jgi:hypothetical protein